MNNSPVGLARFCTVRSWLSQWSYDDAYHSYSGPDQRETLRHALGICTDWLHRHGNSL